MAGWESGKTRPAMEYITIQAAGKKRFAQPYEERGGNNLEGEGV